MSIGAVNGWGVQFGQTMEAPEVGKTYTFAVLAKSVREPVTLRLEIKAPRRPLRPGRLLSAADRHEGQVDRAARHVQNRQTLPARMVCLRELRAARRGFRLDMFRLVEGDYVPYEKAARQRIAAAAVCCWIACRHRLCRLRRRGDPRAKGWVQVPEDAAGYRFRGDAVLVNDRLALVLRRGAEGAELYWPASRRTGSPRGARAGGRRAGRKAAGGGRRGQRSQPGGRGCDVPIARRPKIHHSL